MSEFVYQDFSFIFVVRHTQTIIIVDTPATIFVCIYNYINCITGSIGDQLRKFFMVGESEIPLYEKCIEMGVGNSIFPDVLMGNVSTGIDGNRLYGPDIEITLTRFIRLDVKEIADEFIHIPAIFFHLPFRIPFSDKYQVNFVFGRSVIQHLRYFKIVFFITIDGGVFGVNFETGKFRQLAAFFDSLRYYNFHLFFRKWYS